MSHSQVGQLLIDGAVVSERGKRPSNDDYAALYMGTATERARHGVVAAIADGVASAKGGRAAAELAVRAFIDGYYGRSETLAIGRAASGVLEAVNRWVRAQGRTDPALESMATTFTTLILHGRKAHLLHVGDTRLYRLSGEQLEQLTEDHTPNRPDQSHVLLRAIGLEEGLRVDYAAHALRPHDRFLLSSDGVHGVLGDRRIGEALSQRNAPEMAAQNLVAESLAAGSQDNVTAIVVDVLALPALDRADLEQTAAALPIREPPRAGETIDGYGLEEMLSDGRYSRIFRAIDARDGKRGEVVLKFAKPAVAESGIYRAAFVREAWVAARVRSPFVGEILECIPPERQTCLYAMMPFYQGETLERRLLRAPKVTLSEGVEIAIKLAKAVAALHRAGVVHRDIKPENIVLERQTGGLKLIDLGVARLPYVDDEPPAEIPGTASYMAPELFDGQLGDELSDQFAIGVTIYRMFAAGRYPYGEIEPFSRPRFVSPAPLTRHRPDLPAWLDLVLARCVGRECKGRFGDVIELALELENGIARNGGAQSRNRRPLYHRHPVRFWQIVSLMLLGLLALSLGLR